MTRPLLVAVAQGLDLLTFLVAVLVFGLSIDGEANPVMRDLFLVGGALGVTLLKVAGAAALSLMMTLPYTVLHRYGLIPAVGVGLLGALSNVSAVALTR